MGGRMVPGSEAAEHGAEVLGGGSVPALVPLRAGPVPALGVRAHGLMVPRLRAHVRRQVERQGRACGAALELIPKELETARYRRTMRAAEMNMKKIHLPIEEQNYDPMIPYMAPYMEEAKFQLQEEQELLMYHPYDRRMYTGGVSGLGETMPYGGVTTW